MKKLLLSIAVITLLIIGACCVRTRATEYETFKLIEDSTVGVDILLDRVTGVEYIIFGNRYICPRYDSDGTLYTGDKDDVK